MSKSPVPSRAIFNRYRHLIGQTARRPIKAVSKALSDAILPPRCAGCDAYHDGLFCPRCRPRLQFLQPPWCAYCGLPFDASAKVLWDSICADCRDNRYHAAPPIDALRSIYVFDGPLRNAIHRFKYQGRTSLARPLAQLLDESWDSAIGGAIPDQIDDVVPVPLQAWRQWRRGYNQSELLGEALARRRGLPLTKVLWRRRHTRSQVELSARHRQSNVQDAFAFDGMELPPRYLDGRVILLIDDVCTTGSTLSECARVLRKHGAAKVYALTLARQL